MAAPSYVGQNTGATDAGGAWTVTGTGQSIGVVCILQVLQDGATNGAVTLTSATNIEDLAGTDNQWTAIPGPNGDGSFPVGASAARQFLWIGRTINTSAQTATGGNSTSEDLYMVIYYFTDVSTGTTLATVIENGTAGSTVNEVGDTATASDASVTTLGSDRMALNLLAINDDNFVGSSFTGQSGGTWARRNSYAEPSGTDGALVLMTAAMASAGTIDGGTVSIVDPDAWGVVGFALIGTTVDAPADQVPYTNVYPPLIAQ